METGICSLKQLTMEFKGGTERREAKAGALRWGAGVGVEPHSHIAALLHASWLQKYCPVPPHQKKYSCLSSFKSV